MTAGWCAVFLLAALPGWTQQPAGDDPGTGVIEGTITDSATSGAVRKVVVGLKGYSWQGGAQVELSVSTNSAGHFAFRGLMAGRYGLEARRTGYSSARSDVVLSQAEHTTTNIALTPLGSVSGRIRDEDGSPVPGCSARAARLAFDGDRGRLVPFGAAMTDAAGEYRISELGSGRYYVWVSCPGGEPAPHALLRMDDPRRRSMGFAPQFYPGVPGLKGAGRVTVTPGAEVQGIDLRLRRALTVTLAGRVNAPDPAALRRGLQVELRPALAEFGWWPMNGPFLGRDTGFHFPATAGSYLLVARAWGEGTVPVYTASQRIEIAGESPDPIALVLTRSPDTIGRLEVEGDNPVAAGGATLLFHPIESPYQPQQLNARPDENGAFRLEGLVAGRWRLRILGVNAYVKSLTAGESAVSPYGFDVPQAGIDQLHIVLSTKTGQVKLSAASAPGEGRVTFLLVPVDPEMLGGGLERIIIDDRNNAAIGGIAPGAYRAFALETNEAGRLLQAPEALKALGSRAETITVREGETVQAMPDVIDANQIREALEKAE